MASTPESGQIEVLEFIERRARERRMNMEAKAWANFSFAEAFKRMEEEPDA